MKYFEFEKNTLPCRIINGILYAVCVIFAPVFIYMIALIVFSEVFYKVGIELQPGFIAISCIIWFAVCIIYVIIRLHQLKGVFLYDDHFEITASFMQGTYPVNKKYKYVLYSDIKKIEYVGNFRKDRQARWGKYSVFTYNFLGGRTSNCIKIVFNSDNAVFFSCENNIELMKELKSRMPVYE